MVAEQPAPDLSALYSILPWDFAVTPDALPDAGGGGHRRVVVGGIDYSAHCEIIT